MKTVKGDVTWEGLKQELLSLPKETLVELVNVWVKNYWTNQNYWMVLVEKVVGFDEVARIDGEVWENTAKAQAHRLKKALGLGDDIDALAAVLKFSAAQWAPAGFDWEFVDITENSIFMRVRKCPMGTYRGEQGLPLIPCKFGALPLYVALAKAVNENFQVTCTHAHPDPPEENVMCEWEFILPK